MSKSLSKFRLKYSTQLPSLVSLTLQSKQPSYVWASSLSSIRHVVNQSQHYWAPEQAWCRRSTSLDSLWSTLTWLTKTFSCIRLGKLNLLLCISHLLDLHAGGRHYSLFLTTKHLIHARHIYGHLKWANHCLEGNNDSWDGRFVVSGRWCETVILVCLALLGNTIFSHCVTQDGFTALMGASKGGHTDVVQLLLSSGSKVDLLNKVRNSVNL